MILNLPSTGSPGVLVVEDIGRSTPTKMLIRWLKQASQDDSAERAAAKAEADEQEAAVAAATWWRLAVKPMADLEHLQELVAAGKLEKIHLIRRGYGRGNTPDNREMELTYQAITDKRAETSRSCYRLGSVASTETAMGTAMARRRTPKPPRP